MLLSDLSVKKDEIHFTGILRMLFKSVWKDFRRPLIWLIALGVLAALFQVAAPKVLQMMIDRLTLAASGGGEKGEGLLQELLNLSLLGGLAFLLGASLQFFADKVGFYIATQVEDRWRFTGLLHFYRLPMRWQDQHDSGEVGAKMEQGAVAMFSIIYEIFGQAVLPAALGLISVIAYTFWNFPAFGVILVAPLPLYILVTYFISRRISSMQIRINKLFHEANRTWYDGVGNMRYVKTFGREVEETEYYASRWVTFHQAEYQSERWWLTQSFLQKCIETLVRVVVLYVAATRVLAGSMTVGDMVMLLYFQQLTFAPLETVHRVFTRLHRVTKRVGHLFEIVAEEDTLKDSPGARELGPLKKSLEVKDLHFRYHKKFHALHGVSFKVPAGSSTAIVGRSGAGKSTLAMLLLRFYDPDEGGIFWDSQDIRSATRASLRSRTTMILQDTTLFNRSIADNIIYGRPNASKADMEAAAKLANAHEFIMALPQGYQSVVGERGVRLSGGQRQRIAIARALLVQPELLLMDEATSHLDSETESAIQEAITSLRGKHTQVIIAHRLSTVQHADQILLMDKGKIVARGKHRQLMRIPLYARLCRQQLRR